MSTQNIRNVCNFWLQCGGTSITFDQTLEINQSPSIRSGFQRLEKLMRQQVGNIDTKPYQCREHRQWQMLQLPRKPSAALKFNIPVAVVAKSYKKNV